MKQSDKELLLKDLCGRLPYKVILSVTLKDKYDKIVTRNIQLSVGNLTYITSHSHWREYKPYLRPMSSMTEKERNEYERFVFTRYHEWDGHSKHTEYVELEDVNEYFEFLNAHHLDYRGLIEKGLAIEVTKENNPYED